jgi:hypothetical protein
MLSLVSDLRVEISEIFYRQPTQSCCKSYKLQSVVWSERPRDSHINHVCLFSREFVAAGHCPRQAIALLNSARRSHST